MKFKVGDIVKIICADEISSTHGTRDKIGQTGKIVKFSSYPLIPYAVYFEDDNMILNFMEKEIKLNMKVGEQLMLFEI